MENEGITLSEFNLDRALGGASVGWKDEEGNIIQVMKFKKQNSELFSYQVENMTYYCNKEGIGYENNNKLYMLDLKITETKGTSASRGDSSGGTEIISIEALEPRETFACYALTGLLYGIPNVMQMDNVLMNAVVAKSFEIAQLMMQEAARVRAETPEESGGEDQEIDVNPNLITSTTDKLLYNLNVNLGTIAAQEKTYYEDIQANGIKINGNPKVDIASVSAGTVPVSGSVDVDNLVATYVLNTVDTNVQNTVDVNVQNTVDVNVQNTVDVNVTNFPESGGS